MLYYVYKICDKINKINLLSYENNQYYNIFNYLFYNNCNYTIILLIDLYIISKYYSLGNVIVGNNFN